MCTTKDCKNPSTNYYVFKMGTQKYMIERCSIHSIFDNENSEDTKMSLVEITHDQYLIYMVMGR